MKLLCLLPFLFLLASCVTPYTGGATPHASAAISDTGTSATLDMGAVGEFTFVSSWGKTADGSTTGTVQIVGKKDTMNNFLAGAIGLIGGLAMGGVQ